MAVIKSGASTDQLSIDPTSKAARVTLYNPDGSLQVPAVKSSYVAFSAPFTPGATPQDVFSITGDASKVVRVLCMFISSTQTTGGVNGWQVVKRSTANSGGTSALVTIVRSDPADNAAAAIVRQYTTNPTAGALVGNSWSGFIGSPAPAAVMPAHIGAFVNFTEELGKPMILRSTSDVLSWNFGGVALPAGLSVRAGVFWTEE